MKDPLKLALVAALVVFGVAATVLVYLSSSTAGPDATSSRGKIDPTAPDDTVSDLSILPFSMTAQDGSTVTNDVFKGRITILDFTFTRCTLICPKMTGTMYELSSRLKNPLIQFVSISVDPEHDTPQVLREYATKFEAVPPRWRFLSGDKAAAWSLLRDGLKFGIKENPPLKLPDGSTAPDIRHPAHFVLIGPDGRVLAMYDSNDDQAVARLEARVGQVAAKLPR